MKNVTDWTAGQTKPSVFLVDICPVFFSPYPGGFPLIRGKNTGTVFSSFQIVRMFELNEYSKYGPSCIVVYGIPIFINQ